MARPGTSTPATAPRAAPRPSSSNDPNANVVRVGQRTPLFADLYHDILQMPWMAFLAGVFFTQIGANAVFALLFLAGGDCISNVKGPLDTFYFSVQTWATIGYGGMTPTTTWANMLVVVESAVATIFTAVATGLTFAKFARPSARVLFSNKIVINKRNGKRVLMLRVANERGNYVVEASAHVTLIRDEVSAEGDRMRRVLDLKLVRDTQPIFLFSWLIMHEIDDASPLAGLTEQAFKEEAMRISVSLTAFDGTLSQTIHANHLYMGDAVVFDARFIDVMSTLPDGRTQIDFAKFHDVERVA